MRVLRVQMKKIGSRELLRSDGVVADIAARAQRIADAAGPGFEAEARAGRERALGSVRPVTYEAAEAEARNRVLTRAVDAGRDV